MDDTPNTAQENKNPIGGDNNPSAGQPAQNGQGLGEPTSGQDGLGRPEGQELPSNDTPEQPVDPVEEEKTFPDVISNMRKLLKDDAAVAKSFMGHPVFDAEVENNADHGEMRANIMLAYRHLEDATMRLGKVLQAHDGGVSVYDK